MSAPSVLLLGATGYIGGQILTALLALDTPPSLITCLVRDPAKAALLETIEHPPSTVLVALVGSLADKSDHTIVTTAAEQHEVVINAATADEITWLEAVFEGIRRRKVATGKESIFIHTSGTGMFHDDARGEYATDKVSTPTGCGLERVLIDRSTPTTTSPIALTYQFHRCLQMCDIDSSTYTSSSKRRRNTSARCSLWFLAISGVTAKGRCLTRASRIARRFRFLGSWESRWTLDRRWSRARVRQLQ
jgi:hypothetical protein